VKFLQYDYCFQVENIISMPGRWYKAGKKNFLQRKKTAKHILSQVLVHEKRKC